MRFSSHALSGHGATLAVLSIEGGIGFRCKRVQAVRRRGRSSPDADAQVLQFNPECDAGAGF